MGGNRNRDHPQSVQQRRAIPQSRLRRDSSLYTREPSGTGDADCRVASLLAMTVLNLCHSEEAQRADVGIRLFYDGRGFGPPRSSAPTEGLPKFQQRTDVPKAWPTPTKFRAEIWGVGHGHRPLRKARSATQASRRAAKRPRPRGRGMGGNRCKGHPKRGTAAATAQAALSEAESAERVAGQIRVLPDDLRVQHGVRGSEVLARPRPCSRRDCDN